MSLFVAKLLWEMIEPCAVRMCSVEDFLQDIDPGLQYDIVPIYDPFGPTKEDPNMQVSGMAIDDWKCVH
jgi:phosphopantetheine adenylyltransferase